MPTCQNGEVLCENIEDYPIDLVNTLIGHAPEKFNDFFGSDRKILELGNRIGDDNEEELCSSEIDIIKPRWGQTDEGATLYIVNTEQYIQAIVVEKCR